MIYNVIGRYYKEYDPISPPIEFSLQIKTSEKLKSGIRHQVATTEIITTELVKQLKVDKELINWEYYLEL